MQLQPPSAPARGFCQLTGMWSPFLRGIGAVFSCHRLDAIVAAGLDRARVPRRNLSPGVVAGRRSVSLP
jgi:hypothetical protein